MTTSTRSGRAIARTAGGGWPIEDALIKWTEAAGPTALDDDLLAFVRRQVSLQQHAVVGAWRQTLAELFTDQLNHGLPMHKTTIPTFQEATRQARNAEEALLAVIHACATVLNDPSAGLRAPDRTEIEWPHRFAARDLAARMLQGRRSPWLNVIPRLFGGRGLAITNRCLGWLNLRRADLSGADLSGADLSGADLSGADLSRAHLAEVDLSRADLSEANVSGAVLSGANLSGANLSGAVLSGANLSGANLSEADLSEADLSEADLSEAELSEADLSEAELSGTVLHQARGLDEVQRKPRNNAGTRKQDRPARPAKSK